MAEVGWEDIQVSANQEFDAIKIGQRLSCMLSYIFIVLTRNEEGAVLPRLVNLGFQVKGLLSENVTSNILLYKFINVVKIIYKEFKDMKEQETLNQEALQQEELEEFEELENEQITERFVSFFNQLEAVSGQENNDMVVSARMIRLYKLACSEIEEGIKESPMKNTFSTTTIVDAISKVLDGFFHLTLRLEALVSSPLLLVSKTIHHHVSSLEVFLDICEKDVLSLVGLDVELHIEDEWRE
ncbi:unnamed protein product [Prunus armeniaca]|uniref:Uncharacterized protein n=1 Tax=Prunus armeniaca TaxID=36596 RepID=A0A6J5U836_PRUAR|nr:unnamed protein product [Prunus armeniaca]